MKTVLNMVMVIFFIMSFNLVAQNSIQKGTFNVDGSISYSSTSTELSGNNQKNITLSPQVGYFFLDNISISLLLQYSNTSLADYNNTQWGLGPGIKYYFSLEKVHPFLGLSYLFNKTKGYNNDKWDNSMFFISGGMDYFLNESVALETSISYSFEKYKLPDSYNTYYSNLNYTSNTFRVGVGINVFIK